MSMDSGEIKIRLEGKEVQNVGISFLNCLEVLGV